MQQEERCDVYAAQLDAGPTFAVCTVLLLLLRGDLLAQLGRQAILLTVGRYKGTKVLCRRRSAAHGRIRQRGLKSGPTDL